MVYLYCGVADQTLLPLVMEEGLMLQEECAGSCKEWAQKSGPLLYLSLFEEISHSQICVSNVLCKLSSLNSNNALGIIVKSFLAV